MAARDNAKIEVVLAPGGSHSQNAMPDFISPSRLLDKNALKEQFTHYISMMAEIFNDVTINEDRCEVEQMQFSLQISTEGKIQLLAGVGMGANTAISVTLRRKQ